LEETEKKKIKQLQKANKKKEKNTFMNSKEEQKSTGLKPKVTKSSWASSYRKTKIFKFFNSFKKILDYFEENKMKNIIAKNPFPVFFSFSLSGLEESSR